MGNVPCHDMSISLCVNFTVSDQFSRSSQCCQRPLGFCLELDWSTPDTEIPDESQLAHAELSESESDWIQTLDRSITNFEGNISKVILYC